NRALAALEGARAEGQASAPDRETVVNYVYGYEALSVFDNFGSVLIGFIVFFFVFLVSGISFLQERATGALEKLLSTPIRRAEIVGGYLLGFGFFTALQALVIVFFCARVLRVMLVGSILLVVFITLCGALMALTLGLLLSTAAQSEFQMMQFIPIVIVPQVFFSGLFDLSPQLEAVGRFMPLYYVAESLRAVMLKGAGLRDIAAPICAMLAISLLFALVNIRLLRRLRAV
ncbi:MAG: ABC transporter permease, partial [Clostridiales Family XIII bacterium]|nr:ABC transporter permease [Clostridiales Family XIII bacterium]